MSKAGGEGMLRPSTSRGEISRTTSFEMKLLSQSLLAFPAFGQALETWLYASFYSQLPAREGVFLPNSQLGKTKGKRRFNCSASQRRGHTFGLPLKTRARRQRRLARGSEIPFPASPPPPDGTAEAGLAPRIQAALFSSSPRSSRTLKSDAQIWTVPFFDSTSLSKFEILLEVSIDN